MSRSERATTALVVPEKEDGKKVKKPKLIRDSFTIPKAEFVVIDELKTRCLAWGQSYKKSELLRAGIKLLASLDDAALQTALAQVPTLKTGRPAKEDDKIPGGLTSAASSAVVAVPMILPSEPSAPIASPSKRATRTPSRKKSASSVDAGLSKSTTPSADARD
jgi:hypothetical protein